MRFRGCRSKYRFVLALEPNCMSASLIGRLGSSAFRLSTASVSMSPAGSCFSR